MLSYQQLLQSYPLEMMTPEAIMYLCNAREGAKLQRGSAILEVKHFLDSIRCSKSFFSFFNTSAGSVLEERIALKYLHILQDEDGIALDEEDSRFLQSPEAKNLRDLISKHGLVALSREGTAVSYARAWR